MAGLIGAGRVCFLKLEGGVLNLVEPGYGLDEATASRMRLIPCDSCRPDDLTVQIAFQGRKFRSRITTDAPELRPYRQWLQALDAVDAVAVRWAVGERVLGIAAAYNSNGGRGFTAEDERVLEVAAAAAGLVYEQTMLADRVAEERLRAERLRSTNERLAELEELKRRLLNLAAHELRGPVAVLRGYLSMLGDGSIDAATQRRILPILIGKATQMDLLITRMLEGARMDEGRLSLRPEPLELGAEVRQIVDTSALLAPPGVSVFLSLGSRPVRVQADRERLATIISNLVDNAMKYSPDGGLVNCSVGISGNRAFVRVADHGLGIADEDMPLLFTRFGRIVTPENSHIGGTGLGLQLSQDLARLHGGEILVSSELGRGSEFTLWLPLAAAPAQQ